MFVSAGKQRERSDRPPDRPGISCCTRCHLFLALLVAGGLEYLNELAD
jgi:hypothetical protein